MGTEKDCYTALPLLFPTKSDECEICGSKLHEVEKCTLVDSISEHVTDKKTPSFARLTLPEGLEIKDLVDGTRTVVATKTFCKGSKFGPFIAKTSALMDVRIEFPIKVFLSEEESVYLETYEELFCNWMCLVLPASCANEQNLLCYQIHTSIYFCTLRDIEQGEELRIWYAPYYAEKMGVQSFSKPPDLIHSSDEEFQEMFASLQRGAEMQDHQYLPKLKRRRKSPKKPVLGENYYRAVPPNDILPAEVLGAKERRKEWECKECGQVENNVAAYARHLMVHCKPLPRPTLNCLYCNKRFNKDGYNRQIHLQTCKFKNQNNKNESALHEKQDQSTLGGVTLIIRTSASSDKETPKLLQENKLDNDLPFDNTLWNNIVNNIPNDNNIITIGNNQSITQSENNDGKKEVSNKQHLKPLSYSKTDTSHNATTNSSSNNFTNNDCKISKQKNIQETVEIIKPGCLNISEKNNWNKSDKSLEVVRNDGEETLAENLLVKSHLNTPILDLSDDIEFHLTKSLDDMINDDDCNLEKSLPFAKGRSLDLFGSVSASSLLTTEIPATQTSSLDTTSFYSLEKNGFLQTDFTSCNDVTDEERNRIVENLLSETDEKFFASDYEIAGGCVSENLESESIVENQNEIGKTENNKEKKQSKSGGDYKCDICSKSYSKQIYLFRHLRKHTGEFRCNTCYMVFARKETLESHRLTCSSEARTQETITQMRVTCKFCRLHFHSLSALQDHMEMHYCPGDSREFTCNEVSRNLDPNKNHDGPLSKKIISCTKCKRKFTSEEDFLQHKNYTISRIQKKRERSKLCDVCGLFFHTTTGLRLHKYSVHSEKKYGCSVCGQTFVRVDRLSEHEKQHDKIKWECPVCFKKFSTEKLCKSHHKNMHTDPSFTCPFCDKVFRQKGNYQRHLKTHEPETHICTFCNMKFICQVYLNNHIQQQHGELNFQCDLCGKKLAKKWLLKSHIRKYHSGEMYRCAYCKLNIRFRHSLKKHLKCKHREKMEEWDNLQFFNAMRVPKSPERDEPQKSQRTEPVGMTDNTSINDILQTAANDAMEEGTLNLNDDGEYGNNGEAQQTITVTSTDRNIVSSQITEGNTSGKNTSLQTVTFNIGALAGSGEGSELVSDVSEAVLTIPLTVISDLPLAAQPGPSISSPPQVLPLTAQVSQSPVKNIDNSIVDCPIVLPENYLLTLDSNVIEKSQSDESSPSVMISGYQNLSGASSAIVLTDESVIQSELQMDNNVLFYIVDASLTDSLV